MAGLVPAIPMLQGAVPHLIGITGTRPVMMRDVGFRPITRSEVVSCGIVQCPGVEGCGALS